MPISRSSNCNVFSLHVMGNSHVILSVGTSGHIIGVNIIKA